MKDILWSAVLIFNIVVVYFIKNFKLTLDTMKNTIQVFEKEKNQYFKWPSWNVAIEKYPKNAGNYWVLLRCPQTAFISYKRAFFDGNEFVLPDEQDRLLIGWTNDTWELPQN